MHAGGKYNKTTANAAFVIGNGTDNSARSDAFIIDWNGTVSSTKLATSGIADIEAAIYSLNAVPDSTSADNGKVLTVNSNGTPVWVSGGGGSDAPFSTAIAPEFSTSGTYDAGDAVMYNGKRYVSNESQTMVSWDSTKWTEKSVEDEIGNVEALLAAL